MVFKILKTTSPWEIIIKNTSTNEEFSLMDRFNEKCPFCYYPIQSSNKRECHPGLKSREDQIDFLTGHFYETDYKNIPTNWFSRLLKNISLQPFRHSHKILFEIMKYKLEKSGWDLKSVPLATMVPTKNQQMQQIFSQISKIFNVRWIDFDQLFIKREHLVFQEKRSDYVKFKYHIKERSLDLLSSIGKIDSILIFDDVFHQGWTFGRIIEILEPLKISKFYLFSIARTTPKKLLEVFSFP